MFQDVIPLCAWPLWEHRDEFVSALLLSKVSQYPTQNWDYWKQFGGISNLDLAASPKYVLVVSFEKYRLQVLDWEISIRNKATPLLWRELFPRYFLEYHKSQKSQHRKNRAGMCQGFHKWACLRQLDWYEWKQEPQQKRNTLAYRAG